MEASVWERTFSFRANEQTAESGHHHRQLEHRDAVTRLLEIDIPGSTAGFRLERVVVVDNNSADGSADGLEGISEQPISVLHNDTNQGFAAACNQGAAGTQADYLLFLNPDTRVFPDSLWRPLEFLEQKENGKFGICGVRHVDDSGAFSTSCARFPTLRIFFGQMTGLSMLFPKWFPSHLMLESECLESREVDQIIGAFFLVRRTLFEALGGFDPRFFVYFEEVDFSLRARQAGFRSYYLAATTAVPQRRWKLATSEGSTPVLLATQPPALWIQALFLSRCFCACPPDTHH